jgi:hypothetical protein
MKTRTPLVHSDWSYVGNLALLLVTFIARSIDRRWGTPDQLAEFIAQDIPKRQRVEKEAGIIAE